MLYTLKFSAGFFCSNFCSQKINVEDKHFCYSHVSYSCFIIRNMQWDSSWDFGDLYHRDSRSHQKFFVEIVIGMKANGFFYCFLLLLLSLSLWCSSEDGDGFKIVLKVHNKPFLPPLHGKLYIVTAHLCDLNHFIILLIDSITSRNTHDCICCVYHNSTSFLSLSTSETEL